MGTYSNRTGPRLTQQNPSLIILRRKSRNFSPPDYRPPSSPDLNPLDYGLWSILKQKVYSQKIHDMEHLKRRIRACWKEIPQDSINKTIDRFRARVRKMIEMEGNRFEHLMKWTSCCLKDAKSIKNTVHAFLLRFWRKYISKFIYVDFCLLVHWVFDHVSVATPPFPEKASNWAPIYTSDA